MCAINPQQKKRMVFDFYTSQPLTKEDFDNAVIVMCLGAEEFINSNSSLRVHVKESNQEAD